MRCLPPSSTDFYGCLVGLELLVEYCGKLGVGAPHPAQLARCEEAAISLGFLLGCGLETSVCLARGDTVNSAAIRRKVASCLDEVVKRAVKGGWLPVLVAGGLGSLPKQSMIGWSTELA